MVHPDEYHEGSKGKPSQHQRAFAYDGPVKVRPLRPPPPTP